jgi:HPt (histidine-containing phosphotransfer) domain-containing protein
MLTMSAVQELGRPEVDGDSFHVSPIDLKHLRRYTMGDVALEREVMQLFLAQLPKTIAALSGAVNDHEWRIAAHTLKGSGRAIGAWRIARLAEQAERLAGVKNRASHVDVIHRIEDAVSEAEGFIVETYGSL